MPSYDYDLFVIGGGSGGVRAARVTAGLGKRVAIAEEHRFGGTCVIRGCVPKKLLVYASQFSELFEDAPGYGWTVGDAAFDWPTLIAAKDKEIARLEGLYRAGIEKAGGVIIQDRAVLVDKHTIRLVQGNRTVTAETILIATGSRPAPHDALPGHEFTITSNEAFDLKQLPGTVVIAGGGYIAVEFANIFHGLGVETKLIYRGAEILSRFDDDLRRNLHQAMEQKGIEIICHDVIENIERGSDGKLKALTKTGRMLEAGQIMLALGRVPNTADLGLEAAGVVTGMRGEVLVDEWSRTNVANIYALGDVTDRLQLTPVAIHEAMCFVDTVFRDIPTRPDLENVATAVFSQPEIGTVGLTEADAVKKHGDVDVYKTTFRPMRNVLPDRKERTMMKLLVAQATGQVVGAHVLGPDAGEMAQLLAIAIKGRLTKQVFDQTMAVHPTASEELVTMYQPSSRYRDGKLV